MREIKFRCFEKEKGMWGQDSNSAMNLAMFWAFVADIKGNPNVMQYTGLKDKNGKEIYEGDILQNDWNHNKFIVEWGEGEYPHQSDADSTVNKWNVKYGGCEIIGNLYENPELI